MYLAQAADCVTCHTAKGGIAYAGGLEFDLGFGTLYAPNITPDKATGIGNYSDDDFVRAVQDGIRIDGAHLYPAMPYPSYTLMSREDILAIKAYLFTLQPEAAAIPRNRIDFPYDQRWGVTFWNMLFNPNHRFQPDTSKSAEWNRGAYLVEGPGHCGECHTPRTPLLNVDNGRKMGGAVTQGWAAYNITADKQYGIGSWTDEQLSAFLATGHGEGRSSAAGPMAEVVANSLRYMTPADIKAMVVYLRTIPALANGFTIAANPPAKTGNIAGDPDGLGPILFASECQNCHRFDGTGSQTAHASLVGNKTVNDPSGQNLVRVILEGVTLNGLISMPPFDVSHTDDEIAAVANFVNAQFGGGTIKLAAADIDRLRQPRMEVLSAQQLYLIGGVAALIGLIVLILIIWLIRRLFRGRRMQPA